MPEAPLGQSASTASDCKQPSRLRSPAKTKLSIIILLCIAFVCTALVIFPALGVSYYLSGLCVLVACSLPFFASFEARKPKASSLVIIAILCALAVASRAAFFWLPFFKPMAGIVMISGIALGGPTGFLVGSLSMLISDLFFGIGAWTPWQMFAFGLAGLVFGLIPQARCIKRDSLSKSQLAIMSLLGALFVVLVLGPILDTCSLFLMVSTITPESAIAIYLAGLPVNAVHALATFLVLLVLTNPLLEKLHRVKIKYGM